MQYREIKLLRDFGLFRLALEEHIAPDGEKVNMEVYRTPNGSFIDMRYMRRRPATVRHIAKLQISAIKRTSHSDTCSIGKSAVDGKWYGWSHRAMVGFGGGDRIFEEKYGDDKTLFAEHGTRTITNDGEAKLAASRFAAYVS